MAVEQSNTPSPHSCSWCQRLLLDFDESGDPPQSISLDIQDSDKTPVTLKMVTGFRGLSYFRRSEYTEIESQSGPFRIEPGFDETIRAASLDKCLFAKAIFERLCTPDGDFQIREIFIWRRGIEFVGLHSKLHFQACLIKDNASNKLYRVNPFQFRVPLPTLRSVGQWLALCNRSHSECRQSNTAFMPKRLLEISEDKSKQQARLIDSPRTQPYVALSYCWGDNTGSVCTKDLVETWRAAIPWARIPQTIQDAIHVTIRLGFQYLWVDRFCIIQDDDLEMEVEIAKMPEIYNRAEVTISAVNAGNADDGFLNPSKFDEFCFTEEKFILPARLDGSEASAYIGTPPSRYLMSAESFMFPQPLDTRAWTLQESLLSRRILHFTEREVQWECQEKPLFTSEIVAGFRQVGPYLPATLSRMHNRTDFSSIITSGELYHDHGVRLSQRLWSQHPEMPEIHPWHALVKEYTGRSMTNIADKARAISGIATRISRSTRDEYCAGLWRSTLTNQLGWFCLKQHSLLWYNFVESGYLKSDMENICDPNEEQQRRMRVLKGPSWSWTSVVGPISFLVSTLSPSAEVIDVKLEPKQPEAPFGDINWGHLTLRAWQSTENHSRPPQMP